MPFPEALTALGPSAALITAAAALAGLSRGFSGFGGALIFMPFASAIVGPTVAVPVFIVCDVIMAAPLIAGAMRKADWPDLRPILAGCAVGLPIGNWFLANADPSTLRWAICVAISISLLVLASGWRFKSCPGWRVKTAVGTTSGLLAGMASIGGPPVIVYWLSTAASVAQMRNNLMAFFAFTTGLAIALLAWRGLVTPQVLWLVALCAPGYGAGIWIGSRLFPYASPETYRQIAYALVALSAVTSIPLLDGLLGRKP